MGGLRMAGSPPDDADDARWFASDTFTQGLDAAQKMDLPLDAYLSWPWPDLDAMMGAMAPGQVHYVAGASNIGKTPFTISFVDRCLDRDHKVYVIPTELGAGDWRIQHVCHRVGVNPKEVVNGALKARAKAGDLEAAALRKRLNETMHELTVLHGPWGQRLYVSDLDTLTGNDVYAAIREAKAFGAKVVLIDHVDKLRDRRNVFQSAGDVADAMLDGAKDHGMIVVGTTQLNREAIKGDHLARFSPPRADMVLYGEVKYQNATSMVGLFRRLRERTAQEPISRDAQGKRVDPFAELVKQARAGAVPAVDVLWPNITGVVAMKARFDGEIGKRCYLGFDRGRIVDLPDAERRALDAATNGIRTGDAG